MLPESWFGRSWLAKLGAAGSVLRPSVLAASLLVPTDLLKAEGIPEPSLVIYGVVNNLSGNRGSFGTLNLGFRPTHGGAPITLIGVLTNINDQFSYVLRVPCESEITGSPFSDGTLKLASTPTHYDCSQVSVQGVPASFKQADLANLVLSRTDRGRIERI